MQIRGKLWNNFIKCKYNLKTHIGLEQCSTILKLSPIWKDVCSSHNHLHWAHFFNNLNYVWRVGNGKDILF